jgi:hypothetical protein
MSVQPLGIDRPHSGQWPIGVAFVVIDERPVSTSDGGADPYMTDS